MPKSKRTQGRTTPTTPEAVRRIKSTAYKKQGGRVSKEHYVTRMERTVARRAGKNGQA